MVDWRPVLDIAKILGKTVIDAMDVKDYRITVIIEKKIDSKLGIVVEHLTVEKRMNAIDADIITKKFKELIKNDK